LLEPFLSTLFMLLCAHALADGPLQTPEISAGKRADDLPTRLQYLGVHSLIHGGAVALVTGLWWLGVVETIAHAAIDLAKCRGRISHVCDQSLHMGCKLVWALVAVACVS
jgi:hypothetical protein